MSKSLYDETIGEAEIDIECPECEKELKIKINQIGSTVKCPHCRTEIKLKESGDGLLGVKDALDELEKTLNSF